VREVDHNLARLLAGDSGGDPQRLRLLAALLDCRLVHAYAALANTMLTSRGVVTGPGGR